jgi:hypothetical protein
LAARARHNPVWRADGRGRAPWLAEGLPKHTDLSQPHGVTKQHGLDKW